MGISPFSLPTNASNAAKPEAKIHEKIPKAITAKTAAKYEPANIAFVAEDFAAPQQVRLYTTSFICAATSNTDPGKLP